MAEDHKPASKPDEMTPNEVAPHSPGLDPKPGDPAGESKPAKGAPYDKKGDPSRQPS